MGEEKLQIIRKNREQETLREEWHKTEDGSDLLLLKYPLLEEFGIVKHCFTTEKVAPVKGYFRP